MSELKIIGNRSAAMQFSGFGKVGGAHVANLWIRDIRSKESMFYVVKRDTILFFQLSKKIKSGASYEDITGALMTDYADKVYRVSFGRL